MARLKRLEQQSILTFSQDDITMLARLFPHAFDNRFFKNPCTSKDVIGVSVTGSQDAFKSGFIDYSALSTIPDHNANHTLTFHNDDRAGEYSEIMGKSIVHKGRDVVLSYQDSDPQTFWERFDIPGIHFDQNVPVHECVNPWMSIEIRAPHPSGDTDLAGVFKANHVEDDKISNSLRTLFSYAHEGHLRKAGLLRAFKAALSRDAEMPRLVTFSVYKPELLDNEQFLEFWTMLGNIRKNPDNTTEILETALAKKFETPKDKTLASALARLGANIRGKSISEPLKIPAREERYKERSRFAKAALALSSLELDALEPDERRVFDDILAWHTYTIGPQREPETPHKNVFIPLGKRIQIADLIVNTHEKHKKAYITGLPGIIQLSDRECLILEALSRRRSTPKNASFLAREVFIDPPGYSDRSIKQAITGLRAKLSTLVEDPHQYIQTIRGVGFTAASAFKMDPAIDLDKS